MNLSRGESFAFFDYQPIINIAPKISDDLKNLGSKAVRWGVSQELEQNLAVSFATLACA